MNVEALNVWRRGFVPSLSTKGLIAFRQAVADDDPRLIQGASTQPPPLLCVGGWDVEGGCGASLCGWLGDGLKTVDDVQEFFSRVCFEADQRLGEPASCRFWLNWFDETDRHAMRQTMFAELAFNLGRRWAALDPLCAEAYAIQDALTNQAFAETGEAVPTFTQELGRMERQHGPVECPF